MELGYLEFTVSKHNTIFGRCPGTSSQTPSVNTAKIFLRWSCGKISGKVTERSTMPFLRRVCLQRDCIAISKLICQGQEEAKAKRSCEILLHSHLLYFPEHTHSNGILRKLCLFEIFLSFSICGIAANQLVNLVPRDFSLFPPPPQAREKSLGTRLLASCSAPTPLLTFNL